MTVCYLLGTDGAAVEPAGADFYEQHEVMRDWCDQVQRWTGLEMPQLLREDHTPSLIPGGPRAVREPADLSVRPHFLHRAEVRQAAYAIGIADILAEQGIAPDLISGTSLGGLVAACLAGSFEREELFRLLGRISELPLAPPGEPARGVAFGVLPPGADLDWYCGPDRPHVHLVMQQPVGAKRWVMLSGYLSDLKVLAKAAPPGQMQLVTGSVGGSHTPLQKFMQDLIAPLLDEIKFRDPRVRLISAVGGRRLGTELKTGEDVRESLLESYVAPSSTAVDLAAALEPHRPRLGLTIGSALRFGPPPSSFPVLQAAVNADLGQIMALAYDLGVELRGD